MIVIATAFLCGFLVWFVLLWFALIVRQRGQKDWNEFIYQSNRRHE